MTTFDDRFSLHLHDIHSTEKTEQMLLQFPSTNPQNCFHFPLFWLCRVLGVACWMFSCGMWNLVPWPGLNPRPLHWTTREIPTSLLLATHVLCSPLCWRKRCFCSYSASPCSAQCPNPWAGREKAFKTMQFTKREVYYWLESGLSAETNAVVHGQKSLKQRLLAKFIRYAYAVSSWLKLIGYMFAKQVYWYKLSRSFQLSLCFLLGAYWLAGSRLPDGGGESYHFGGSQNLGPGRLSWY